MTKTFLVAALTAFLLAPAALPAHAGYTGPTQIAGETSKCDSITDPVKKQECMKQEQGKGGQRG